MRPTSKKNLFLIGALLLICMSRGYGQYTISGGTQVLTGISYAPYSISGGPTSTADHWCVTAGTLNGTNNTCMPNQNAPSISVTWYANGTLSYYVGNSTTPAATFSVTAYSVTNNIQTNPNAEFAPDFFPFVPLGQNYTLNLTGTNASVPGGSVNYTWNTSSDGTNYFPLQGGNAQNFQYNQVFTQTTYITRSINVNLNGTVYNNTTSPIVVNAASPVQAGQITPTNLLIKPTNTSAITFTGSAGSGGTMCGGNITYTWQKSTDNVNWTNVGTGATYISDTVQVKTYFRQLAFCGPIAGVSNTAIVDVYKPLNGGIIGPTNITVPSNGSPGTLVGNVASGGNITQPYTYEWQYCSDPSFPNASTISLPPSVSALSYSPANIGINTYFRRVVTCDGQTAYSNIAYVQVGSYTTGNYIRTRVVTAANITSGSQADALSALSDVKQTTDYFDGLGRPIQTVSMMQSLVTNAAPTDLVHIDQYDPVGREILQYLPYASTAADGNLKTSPFQDQNTYNNAQFPGETYNYGQVNFEASALNRVNSASAPGSSWTGSNRAVQNLYCSNSLIDAVAIWNVINSNTPGTFGTYSIPQFYPAGSLYKNITTDENGKQVIIFKDMNDQVILKKVQVSPNPGDDGTGSGYTGWLCTYYIYDNWGNLRCVIQPHGVELLMQNSWNIAALSNAILTEQCFRYEYDLRNRMIMKQVPGKAAEYMVYDALDRLVMSQDGNLRGAGQWQVTLFENILDRPIQTGLYTTSIPFSGLLPAAASSVTYPFPASGAPAYPTWELLTVTHYDDYSGIPTGLSGALNTSAITMTNFYSTYNTSPSYAQPLTQISPATTITTKGLVMWTQAEVLHSSDGQFISTANIYDNRGRVIQQQTINYGQGLDISTTQYDFSGKSLIEDLRHQKNTTPAQTYEVVTRNTYDDLGRPTKMEKMLITSLVPSPAWKTISTMAYDGLGRLATKTIGNNFAGTGPAETQAYEYNIRGWLLGENRNFINNNSLPSSNYFGFELGYDKQATIVPGAIYAHQQYNGNIEGEIWKNGGDGAVRKYDFAYDAANRLWSADFNQYNSSFNKNDGLDFSVLMGDGVTPGKAYDANGNILAMTQKGWTGSGSAIIDNLTYNYLTNTNRLQNVIDAANNPSTTLGDFRYSSTYTGTFVGGTKPVTATDYGYDPNSNLNSDKNKDITSISYNYLNLPETIVLSRGTITYLYDALGNKLSKMVYEPNAVVSSINTSARTTTTYLSGFVYETKSYTTPSLAAQQYTDNLQYFVQEEGRVRGLYNNPTTPYVLNGFAFDYLLKDHLGNTRVTLTEEQETDPYPTLSFEGSTSSDVANQNAVWDNNAGTTIDVLNSRTAVPAPFSGSSNTSWCRSITKPVAGGIGAAKLIKVMAGDQLNVSVDYTYLTGTVDNSGANGLNTLAATLVNMIMGSSDVSAVLKSQAATISSNTTANSNVINFFSPESAGGSVPKAYLHILLFNNQFVFDNVHSVVMPILSSALNTKQSFTPTVPIVKSGYAYIYFSNESYTPVYFDNLALTDVRGPLLETNDYYPFGLTMAGISDKALKYGYSENKHLYNEKELQNKEFSDGSGLAEYDYGARIYDPQLGRFNTIDPLGEKYFPISPYTYTADNPIKYTDPNGEDFILTITRNNKNEITGVNISSTIYIKGDGASSKKAGELNKFAASVLKSQKVDGVNVSFGVNYVFDANKKPEDLKEGENILTFDPRSEDSEQGRNSEVKGAASIDEDGDVTSYTGNQGTVFGSGNSNSTVLHESLHLIGLSDRYDEYDDNNLTGAKRYTPPQKGFEHDIMADHTQLNLNIYHYQRYAEYGKTFSKIFFSDVTPMNTHVDRNPKGNLLTPYEAKGIHTNNNADR